MDNIFNCGWIITKLLECTILHCTHSIFAMQTSFHLPRNKDTPSPPLKTCKKRVPLSSCFSGPIVETKLCYVFGYISDEFLDHRQSLFKPSSWQGWPSQCCYDYLSFSLLMRRLCCLALLCAWYLHLHGYIGHMELHPLS